MAISFMKGPLTITCVQNSSNMKEVNDRKGTENKPRIISVFNRKKIFARASVLLYYSNCQINFFRNFHGVSFLDSILKS